jgi:Fur family peroxide stress response transcriptional regulator
MITNFSEAKAILATRSIKPTYQRLRILEAVSDTRDHPTIKALYDKLIRTVPTLSKTTLYSTLELFAAKGLVTRLSIDAGEARYDGFPAPHHHFHCERCGAILDLDIACATGRRGEVQGHAIKEVHGYFKGICKDCLSRDHHKIPRRSSHV